VVRPGLHDQVLVVCHGAQAHHPLVVRSAATRRARQNLGDHLHIAQRLPNPALESGALGNKGRRKPLGASMDPIRVAKTAAEDLGILSGFASRAPVHAAESDEKHERLPNSLRSALEEMLASERKRADAAEDNLALARKALAAAMLGWSDANTRPVIEVSGSLVCLQSVEALFLNAEGGA
jgi:hypothetical protein